MKFKIADNIDNHIKEFIQSIFTIILSTCGMYLWSSIMIILIFGRSESKDIILQLTEDIKGD